jgi:hypothetical protein
MAYFGVAVLVTLTLPTTDIKFTLQRNELFWTIELKPYNEQLD